MHDSIVVDGVLASCYAFSDQDLAHMAMLPIRSYPEVMEWLIGIEDGFTGFAKIAENLGNYMLPYDSLYWWYILEWRQLFHNNFKLFLDHLVRFINLILKIKMLPWNKKYYL